MGDGTLYDETQQDTDWDGVWEAAVRITPDGWDVEMRIPLHLLRFDSGPDVSFGINFSRRISRLNESDQWQFIPPEFRFGAMLGDLIKSDAQHTLLLKISYLWG